MKKILMYVCFAVLMCTSAAYADVIIDIEIDPPVNAGDLASVSFFATSNTSQQITGLNLPIDVGADGMGLPAELSFASAPLINALSAVPDLNLAPAPLSIDNVDGIANVVGFAPVTLSTSATLLFDLQLEVDPTAPTGSFPISINSDGTFFEIAAPGGVVSRSDITVNSGSVNIVGVPEPTSALVVLACGGLVLSRRRR